MLLLYSTQELLKSFNMHTGVITKLVPLTPPSLIQGAIDITSPLRHSFMSIGADHCIGIFSLDTKTCQHWFTGHTADIVEVRWKVEQGYILVACADTSVTVWEVLDNIITKPFPPKKTSFNHIICLSVNMCTSRMYI